MISLVGRLNATESCARRSGYDVKQRDGGPTAVQTRPDDQQEIR